MFWYLENVVVDDDDNDDGHDDDHDDELENVSENEHFSNEQHFNTGWFEKRRVFFWQKILTGLTRLLQNEKPIAAQWKLLLFL